MRKKIRWAIVMMAIAITMAAAVYSNLSQDPIEERQPAHLFDPSIKNHQDVRGTWHSVEYGWILDITEDTASLYDMTDAACTGAGSLLASYETYFHAYSIKQGRLGLNGLFDPYTYYFDPVQSLPARCLEPRNSSPQDNFAFFVDVMTMHYAFFQERNIDWQSIVRTNAPRITSKTTQAELWSIFKDMLRPIKDGHMALRHSDGRQYLPGRGKTMKSIVPLAQLRGEQPQELFEAWHADYADQIREDLLGGRAQWRANDRIIFGIIDDGIGYLNIRSMGGYVENYGWTGNDFRRELDTLNEVLEQAMELFTNVEGVIIDVSDNSGGFGIFGNQIAARFTDVDVPGNFRYPAVNPKLIHQEPPISPVKGNRFTGPVTVVSSNLTISAGESFLMTMKLLPHVRVAGEPTRGAFSEVMTKTLPNGWELDLSNEHYLDSDMISWEGKGILPDISLQIFNPENIFQGHVDAIRLIARNMQDDTG